MTRTWLITGASRGFGRSLAEAVLDRGDRLLATARRPEQLADLASGYGALVRTAALDVTDARAARAAVDVAVAEFGCLDVVVNNAGYANSGPIEEMFARAESHPRASRFPFEVARIRLAHGIRVRHVRGRPAARHLLAAAAEAFERLGAAGWIERARAELRAAGAAPRASTLNVASLTWQERRIADLAAGGLTNKEIGKRMHLSPRTVSSHLYRVFPKLGISTRAALRDALSRAGEVSQP